MKYFKSRNWTLLQYINLIENIRRYSKLNAVEITNNKNNGKNISHIY